MNHTVFSPAIYNTSTTLAATATTANVAVTGDNVGGTGAKLPVRITNAGPNAAFLNFGTTSAVTATTAAGMELLSGTSEVFLIPASVGVAYVAAICAATQTAALSITPGTLN